MRNDPTDQSTPRIYGSPWDYCVVQVEIIDKQRFGLLGKEAMTLAKWIAKPTYDYAEPFAEQIFTADTRQGENYNEHKANALGDFLLQLEQNGWEIMDDVDLNSNIIYLRKAKTDIAATEA